MLEDPEICIKDFAMPHAMGFQWLYVLNEIDLDFILYRHANNPNLDDKWSFTNVALMFFVQWKAI